MLHNSKTTRLVYPLALRTNNVHSKCRTLFHNNKGTHSVYPSALPLQPKVGFIPVNLSTRKHSPGKSAHSILAGSRTAHLDQTRSVRGKNFQNLNSMIRKIKTYE